MHFGNSTPEKEALKIPAGKIALILGALGLAHTMGQTAKHTTKGAIKEMSEPYDERSQLSRRTRA